MNVTSFQIEKDSDEVLLYDATPDGNNLIGEITSLGEFKTSTSELLIFFKSDCDVTNQGFQAVVEFVKKSAEIKNNNSKTITTSTKTKTKTMQKTTTKAETHPYHDVTTATTMAPHLTTLC